MACPCRDLKAENVLLHQQGHWVLCDFGSTTSFAGVYESTNAIMAAEEIIRKYTTPAYRAPEVGDQYLWRCQSSWTGINWCCWLKLVLLLCCDEVAKRSMCLLLQMYDLYSRERIDTKADIWVSWHTSCICHPAQPVPTETD